MEDGWPPSPPTSSSSPASPAPPSPVARRRLFRSDLRSPLPPPPPSPPRSAAAAVFFMAGGAPSSSCCRGIHRGRDDHGRHQLRAARTIGRRRTANACWPAPRHSRSRSRSRKTERKTENAGTRVRTVGANATAALKMRNWVGGRGPEERGRGFLETVERSGAVGSAGDARVFRSVRGARAR